MRDLDVPGAAFRARPAVLHRPPDQKYESPPGRSGRTAASYDRPPAKYDRRLTDHGRRLTDHGPPTPHASPNTGHRRPIGPYIRPATPQIQSTAANRHGPAARHQEREQGARPRRCHARVRSMTHGPGDAHARVAICPAQFHTPRRPASRGSRHGQRSAAAALPRPPESPPDE
jgi:hypothetical protein